MSDYNSNQQNPNPQPGQQYYQQPGQQYYQQPGQQYYQQPQQQYYQQPQQQYYQQPPQPKQSNKPGTAGFVLALIGFILTFVPFLNNFSFILTVLGTVFSIIGMFKKPKTLAILGLVFVVLTFLAGIAIAILAFAMGGLFDGAMLLDSGLLDELLSELDF